MSSYNGYSSYLAQTQYEQPNPQMSCYEYGDTRHIMRKIVKNLGETYFIKALRLRAPLQLLHHPHDQLGVEDRRVEGVLEVETQPLLYFFYGMAEVATSDGVVTGTTSN